MKNYTKYIKAYWSAFVLGPILMIIEVIGEVMLPYFISLIINNGIPEKNVSYIIMMGGVMVVTILIMMLGGVGGCYFSTKAAVSFASDLRRDVFKKVQGFSFNNIDKFSTGSLVTRLTNDITQMQNVIRMALTMLLRAPGMLIGAIIMAAKINRQLTLIIAIVVPLLALVLFCIIKIAYPRFEKMQSKIDGINSNIQESLTNVRVIKSFVREDFEEEKFALANNDLKQGSLRALKIVIFTMPIMMLTMNFTTLAVVWYGGNFVIEGGMPIGDLIPFTTYIVQILVSLMILSMVLLQSSRALASASRISEVLEEEIDLNDDLSNRKLAEVKKGKVEFKNVDFKYYKENEEYILKNISFVAEPGEVVGIIGATGSGKTSLVQLIPRLYDTYEGEVLVDGINVKDYALKNLREGVGMVLQKNILFSGTIMENLLWGDEVAKEEEVISFAENAAAHDFIQKFPEAYETELGQGGVNISGGQKQRLCIARALLKKPKILILDDSTSAVDTATEAKIRESFNHELKETTKIIIAQRINSVMEADKIIVLDEGQIVGIGTHEELMQHNEDYKEIYYSQKDKEVSA